MILSKNEKNRPLWWLSRSSSNADSAGVSVTALNTDSATANAIVIENWAYSRPVVPGKNATGTNTAMSTRPVASTAPNTSRIASDAACLALLPYSWMCRSMFSITTMASSTTMPVARMMPKSVRVLIEKPISLVNANAPISDTGMVTAGMIVLRQVCRKMKMTSTTSAIASASVLRTSLIDSSTTSVVLNAT